MKLEKILSEIIGILLAVVIFIVVTDICAFFLIPARSDFGAVWEQYKKEPENNIDLIVIGSSIVYCDIVPADIYEKSGIKTYLVTGPSQTMSLSYYYLKEACKTQKPSAVAVELSGLFFGKYQNFTRVNIDYMPWGLPKIEAILHSAEPGLRKSLLVPIWNYHDRWYKVSQEELNFHVHAKTHYSAGYQPLTEYTPITSNNYREISNDEYNLAFKYLQKISEYCNKKKIKLILYYAPSMGGKLSDTWSTTLQKDISTLNYCVYHNFNEDIDSIDLNSSKDWYDGFHLNLTGAQKFSDYFTNFIVQNEIEPQANKNNSLWKSRIEYIADLRKQSVMSLKPSSE